MVGVMEKMGKVIARLKNSSKNGEAVDKIDTLRYSEEITDTLSTLYDMVSNEDAQKDIIAACMGNVGGAYEKTLETAYGAFLRALSISNRVVAVERRAPLSVFISSIDIAIKDLEEIRSHYGKIFNGTTSASMSVNDLKVTTAIALGYIEACYGLCQWGVYLINIVYAQKDNLKVAPYQLTTLVDQAPAIATTCAEICNRAVNQSFVDMLMHMRGEGTDVHLETDGMTIDQYANDHDYTASQVAMMANSFRSPILIFGEMRVQRRRERYEQLKDMREFLATRLSMIHLQMAETEEGSEQYKKLEKIAANYADMIARHDKKIKEYEDA